VVKIALENISKCFDQVKAVDDVNLEIRDGEFLVLLGPSGCGKTTTLRILAGLERQTSGNVYFNERLVNELEPRERNIAMVFQEYALYPHMSASDNLTLCLKVAKVPKDTIDERLQMISKMLKIEHLLSRKPGELSGGQQQRVALGRAIIREPSVFLLDEPLSNLDAMLRVSMRVELKKLQQNLRITTIYVTHDQTEAMIMADRVAIMKDGKLLQSDAPDRIYSRPANKFVGEFVGSRPMNFFECELVDNDKGSFLDLGHFSTRIPPELLRAIRSRTLESKLIMGIRPEHLTIKKGREEGSVEGRLYLIQRLGDVSYANVLIGPNLLTATVDPKAEFRQDQVVFVELDMNHICLFDKKTEDLIL
jgi:multiple sugar transport system ATP-binding protein